jgi:hypothetical protein
LKFFLKKIACSCHGEDGNKKKIRILLQFKQITNWVPEKILPTSFTNLGGSKQASKPASQPQKLVIILTMVQAH